MLMAIVLYDWHSRSPNRCKACARALESFFMTMAKTVKGFPLRDQVEIKKKIFQLISDKEMDIALKMCEQPPSTCELQPQPGTSGTVV